MKKLSNKKLMLTQFIISIGVFSIFLMNILVIRSDYSVYALIPLLIAGLILALKNNTTGKILNPLMLALTPLMFVFLIEYLASIIGLVISIVYLIRITLKNFKK